MMQAGQRELATTPDRRGAAVTRFPVAAAASLALALLADHGQMVGSCRIHRFCAEVALVICILHVVLPSLDDWTVSRIMSGPNAGVQGPGPVLCSGRQTVA